jgi:hypothetical protein
MYDSRDSSTVVALRELRSHQDPRHLADKREQARERALDKQLRLDLQHAQDELHRVRLEAERRVVEAAQAARDATRNLPASGGERRWSSYLAWGSSAVLASALVLVLLAWPAPVPTVLPAFDLPRATCPEAPPPALPAVNPSNPAEPKPNRPTNRPPAVRPHPPIHSTPAATGPHHPPPKPACDGTDPLCGLNVKTIGP